MDCVRYGMETLESAGFVIRRFQRGDEAGIVDLLVRVFGAAVPGYEIDSVERWQQKFLANPAGCNVVVVEDGAGRIVGHYAGVPIRVAAKGRLLRFSQACDTCTDPVMRRGLRNPGIFVRLVQAYVSTFAQPPSGDAVMYGLPIPQAYTIGARYADYWMLRTQAVLVGGASVVLPAVSDAVAITELGRFPAEMDAWSEIVGSWSRCCGLRDAGFLNWRFRDQAFQGYRAAIATSGSGQFRGYAVYRKGELLGRDAAVIMDWMVEPGDLEAGAGLLRWLATAAHGDALREMILLSSPSTPWFRGFQDWGFKVEPTPYVMVGRPFATDIQPAWLRENWNYSMADLDVL